MPHQTSSTDEAAKIAANFRRDVSNLLPKLKVGQTLSPTHAEAIRVHRQVGEVVLRYVPKDKGGEELFESLGKAVGHFGRWVRHLRTFVLKYSKDEMEKLFERAPAVTFSHVIQLLSVQDRELRDRLEKALGDNRWTVQKLRSEIIGKMGGPRRKGGRRIEFSENVADELKRMRQDVENLNRRWQKWLESQPSLHQLKRPKTKSSFLELCEALEGLLESVRKLQADQGSKGKR